MVSNPPPLGVTPPDSPKHHPKKQALHKAQQKNPIPAHIKPSQTLASRFGRKAAPFIGDPKTNAIASLKFQKSTSLSASKFGAAPSPVLELITQWEARLKQGDLSDTVQMDRIAKLKSFEEKLNMFLQGPPQAEGGFRAFAFAKTHRYVNGAFVEQAPAENVTHPILSLLDQQFLPKKISEGSPGTRKFVQLKILKYENGQFVPLKPKQQETPGIMVAENAKKIHGHQNEIEEIRKNPSLLLGQLESNLEDYEFVSYDDKTWSDASALVAQMNEIEQFHTQLESQKISYSTGTVEDMKQPVTDSPDKEAPTLNASAAKNERRHHRTHTSIKEPETFIAAENIQKRASQQQREKERTIEQEKAKAAQKKYDLRHEGYKKEDIERDTKKS